jgi:hypothetical protein
VKSIETEEADMFHPVAALTVSRGLLAGRLENDSNSRNGDSRKPQRRDELGDLDENVARGRALRRALATSRIGPRSGELEGSW